MPLTAQLTAQAVKDELKKRVGSRYAIQAPELAAQILKRIPTEADTRNVRRLVKQLRLAGEPICSHSNRGYWWAANPEELEVACEFLRGSCLCSISRLMSLRPAC